MLQRKLYLAPDTNFLIHGRPLEGLTNVLLGVDRPFIWLLLRTVIKEIDHKTHHSNSRIKRRAATSIAYIDEGDSRRNAGAPVETYFPQRPIPYLELGFDPYDADERIRAEIVTFKNLNHTADVMLLTLDRGMKIQARQHGISLVVPAEDLRVADEENETERDLRIAQRKIEELTSAQPNLILKRNIDVTDVEIPIYPPLSQSAIDSISASLSVLENKSSYNVMFAAGLWRQNPSYSEQLLAYENQLREVIPELWRSMGVASLEFILDNSGNVEATDVRVDIMLPDAVVALDKKPKDPDIPSKPPRYIYSNPSVRGNAIDAMHLSSLGPLRAVPLRGDEPIERGPVLKDTSGAWYWRRTIRQRQSIILQRLYIEMRQPIEAFEVAYEIRAKNVAGVRTGQLLVKTTCVSMEDATTEVEWRLQLKSNGARR